MGFWGWEGITCNLGDMQPSGCKEVVLYLPQRRGAKCGEFP